MSRSVIILSLVSVLIAAALVTTFVLTSNPAETTDEETPTSDSATESPGTSAPADLDVPESSDPKGLEREAREAIDAARQRVFENPDDAVTWLQLGMIFDTHKDDRAAEPCYQAAMRLDPQHPKASYYLAHIHHRDGSIDDALSRLTDVQRIQPEFPPAWWRAAAWHLEAGDLDRAANAAAQALERAPSDATTRRIAARVAIARAEFDKAVLLLEPLASAGLLDSYSVFLLGSAYRGLGRMDDAEPLLAAGRPTAPAFDDAWIDELREGRTGLRAQVAQALEMARSGSDVDGAIEMLQRLREEHPDDTTLVINLALAHRHALQHDIAVDLLREVVAARPGYDLAHFQLAGVLRDMGRPGPDQAADLDALGEALVHAEEVVRLSPTWGPGHGMHGEILTMMGRNAEAIEPYQKASQFDPQVFLWWYRTGVLLCRERGDWAGAVSVLTTATELDPRHIEAHRYLAAALANSGQAERALEVLNHALTIDPTNQALIRGHQQVSEAIRNGNAGGGAG